MRMMSNTSWTITSTKRKSDNAMAAPRKRSRLSNSRTKSQKTLTQAQWMTPPSNQLANDELLLEETNRPRTLSRTNPSRRMQKRDSTLTQMGFFDPLPVDQEDIDDHLLPQINSPSRDDMPLPQLDGAYSSPRKPRKRKTSIDLKQQPKVKKNPESQEYKPSTRKSTIQNMEKEALPGRRRTSRRLASKQVVFTDPTQSFEYFNEALTGPLREVEPEANEPLGPQLEIKDSLLGKEAEVQADVLPSKFLLRHLHTPTKGRTIILSSQSPESLPSSTRKRVRLESPIFTSEKRTPLAERSINCLQENPTKQSSKRQRNRQSLRSPSSARKLVVLKLPKRRLGQQVPRIEDSQKNIWSIPSSSSQQQRDESFLSARQPVPTVRDELEGVEIPASSQAYNNVVSRHPRTSTQDSLPDVADLVERRPVPKRDDTDPVEKGMRSQHPLQNGTVVRDFATAPRETETAGSADGLSDSMLLHSESLLGAPTDPGPIIVEDSEEEEDLISPARLPPIKPVHDGQSTPMQQQQQRNQGKSGGQNQKALPFPSVRNVNDRSSQLRSPQQSIDETRNPLSLPQLVSQSATQRQQAQASLSYDTDEFQLPRPPLIHRSSTHVSTTQIPLNDIRSTPSSSIPSAKSITQKSVNPASMPHPSQMSTQDATQGFLTMSSFPQPLHDSYEDEKNDKITIKDSSSCHVSMSQLPQHMSTTQSQPTIDLGLDEVFGSDGEEDLDLDPPSTASRHDYHPSSDIQIERTPPAKRTVDVLHQNTNGVAKGKHVDHSEGSPKVTRQALDQTAHDSPIPSSQQSISTIPSSPNPPLPQKKYAPIPGFNNDTQSNFTQNGHVTAAYVHRQWEAGVLPEWFTPKPYQIPGYTRRK